MQKEDKEEEEEEEEEVVVVVDEEANVKTREKNRMGKTSLATKTKRLMMVV